MSNAHVHPLFQDFCAIASGELQRAASQPPMQHFIVRVCRRGQGEMVLDVMGRSRAQVEDSHLCLIDPELGGGVIEVLSPEEWEARKRMRAEQQREINAIAQRELAAERATSGGLVK